MTLQTIHYIIQHLDVSLSSYCFKLWSLEDMSHSSWGHHHSARHDTISERTRCWAYSLRKSTLGLRGSPKAHAFNSTSQSVQQTNTVLSPIHHPIKRRTKQHLKPMTEKLRYFDGTSTWDTLHLTGCSYFQNWAKYPSISQRSSQQQVLDVFFGLWQRNHGGKNHSKEIAGLSLRLKTPVSLCLLINWLVHKLVSLPSSKEFSAQRKSH